MDKLEQTQLYMILACLIAGFGYNLPFCLNMAIGICIGCSMACTALFISDWKRNTKEIKQLEYDSKKLDILLEYVRKKQQYDSKIPNGQGCHEQTESSTE